MGKTIWIGLFAAGIGLAGCTKQEDQAATEPATQPQATAPAAHPPVTPPAATGTPNQGRVLSTSDAGGYTYIEVDIDGKSTWLASSRAAVKQGDTVAWQDSAPMTNFTSKAMGRTFDEIYFVAGVQNLSAPAPATSGRVASVQSAAGYNYIEVDRNGSSMWLAAPASAVKVGDNIAWTGGATMRNYASKSLNRTFEEVLFVGDVQVLN